MDKDLAAFLSEFPILSEEERGIIGEQLIVGEFKKGDVLLREGEISDECYFVLKGCVRQYYLKDGDEKTTAFFAEREVVTSYLSYQQQIPSKHFFECAEDCKLIVGNLRQEKEMYEQHPKLVEITRQMMEEGLGKVHEEMAAYITASPEERYLSLSNNRPRLLQRIPQHQIASFVGVTPESLSRIRKRLLVKK